MSRRKTHYIFSTTKRGNDNKAARRAIKAVQEVVRAARSADRSKVNSAKAAYIKAIDDAVIKFDTSK